MTCIYLKLNKDKSEAILITSPDMLCKAPHLNLVVPGFITSSVAEGNNLEVTFDSALCFYATSPKPPSSTWEVFLDPALLLKPSSMHLSYPWSLRVFVIGHRFHLNYNSHVETGLSFYIIMSQYKCSLLPPVFQDVFMTVLVMWVYIFVCRHLIMLTCLLYMHMCVNVYFMLLLGFLDCFIWFVKFPQVSMKGALNKMYYYV